MKKLLLSVLSLGAVAFANAQNLSVIMTSQSQIYLQDFDSLLTSGTGLGQLPMGWWIAETGTSGNTTYRAGDGSTNNGDTYSFGTGTSSERSLGGVASSSVVPFFGARFINSTGAPASQFSYNLMLEQWRSGGRTDLDSMYFSYSINNGVSGTWTRVQSNDLTSKVTQGTAGALNGNLAANSKYYQFTVSSITWNVGDTLYIRWQDPNVAGNDDGLSIDNFGFTIAGTLPVKYSSFAASQTANGNLLKWATASESNNSGFEVQRSTNGSKFATIGFVKGAGNSASVKSYSFVDGEKVSGTSCYRLKQIDFNGKSELSKEVCVAAEKASNTEMSTTPNPFNGNLTVNYGSASEGTAVVEIIDVIGKVHYNGTESLVKGNNTFNVNTEALPHGVYFVRISQGSHVKTQRIIKK